MKAFFLFLMYSFCSIPLPAQTGEEALYRQLKKADKELATVYKQLEAKLTDKTDKNALIASQQAWLTYKEANCKFLSREESEGGVIANKLKLACIIRSTQDRISVLREALTDY